MFTDCRILLRHACQIRERPLTAVFVALFHAFLVSVTTTLLSTTLEEAGLDLTVSLVIRSLAAARLIIIIIIIIIMSLLPSKAHTT